MGGWVPACWVRRVGRLRPVLPLSPDSRSGVGGMTQTRVSASLDYVV